MGAEVTNDEGAENRRVGQGKGHGGNSHDSDGWCIDRVDEDYSRGLVKVIRCGESRSLCIRARCELEI